MQKKQREFEEYIRDKYITAKADFRTLLKETKFITYRCVWCSVSHRQSLSLLVLTLMARAYFAFTHMLTLLIFRNKKKPTFIKGQIQPISTLLFFFFFLKKGPRCQFLFCVTHPSSFWTYFCFYFTAFLGVPLGCIKIVFHTDF